MSPKARNIQDLQRGKPKRSPYERVLIVCEGAKTEPNYFNALVAQLRLNTANVEIDGGSDSSPRSVVAYAKRRYKEDWEKQGKENGFDRVYCVFDKDEHATYQEALSNIKEAKPSNTFYPINSVPCFEFWLLLHFIYTTMPIVRTGDRSPGDNTLRELKRFLPNYNKGAKAIYNEVKDKTETAIKNAQKVNKASNEADTDNPSTLVHTLVEYLYRLSK